MAERINYDEITESHLSKKYNDLLYDSMMRVNLTGYQMEAEPHINNLRPYFSATYVLYRNTFMLFYGIKMKDKHGDEKSLAKILIEKMREIKDDMRFLKNNPSAKGFEDIMERCDIVHMLIMDGLQKRHMLVRLGQSEPRGEESIFYWDDKEAFKKGGVKLPGVELFRR